VRAGLVNKLVNVLAAIGALGACALPLSVSAAPNDEVYTVGNYPVDAQAKNAVAAKDKALADGQEAAFRSLLKRVVPVTDYDRLKRLSALNSSDFFEGVSVRSERNSRTRYIASLDFAFRADSVRAVLRQAGVPFVEEQAREIVVVPVVLNTQGGVDNGAAARAWRDIWKSLDLKHTLTPLDLESLKPEIDSAAMSQLLQGGGAAQRVLADKYGQPYVIAAIAEPDAAAERLKVTLVGTDAVGPLFLSRNYRVFDGDTGYTMELAAVVGQGVLEGRWKAHKTQTGAAAMGAQITLQAQYASFSEWRTMRQRLLSIPGVNDVRIGAESAQAANLTLRYPGGANELASALYTQGLSLSGRAGGWVLRSGY
jgi:Uncharacterized protein conserved in bacteria (DUF2066)